MPHSTEIKFIYSQLDQVNCTQLQLVCKHISPALNSTWPNRLESMTTIRMEKMMKKVIWGVSQDLPDRS